MVKNTTTTYRLQNIAWGQILAALEAAMGVTVMFGWGFNLDFIVRPIEGLVAMNPTTALCFLLLGIAVWLLHINQTKTNSRSLKISIALSVVVALISLLKLTFIPNIDLWLCGSKIAAHSEGVVSNRMAANTAVSFILSSSSLLILRSKVNRPIISQLLVCFVIIFGVISVIGYQFEVPEFYTALRKFPMAITTAISFVVLALSILLVRQKEGIMKEFSGESKSAKIIRYVIPAVLGIPLIMGVFLLGLANSEVVSYAMVIALLVLFFIILFPIMVWFIIREQNRKNRIKEKSEQIDKLLRQEHIQNEKLLNFANIVSHNLRSNSANLTMFMDIISDENLEFKQDEIYGMMWDAVDGLKSTIINLQDIVDVHNTDLDQTQVLSVHDFVEEAVFGLTALALDANVTITNETDKNHHVKAIPAYFASICINLISNAIKYRNPNKQSWVRIHSTNQNGYTNLIVEDNGLGMNLDFIGDKLFGMYGTFHENKDSHGIGLFLTKNQIETMHGNISVESELEKGTKFIVSLPDEND